MRKHVPGVLGGLLLVSLLAQGAAIVSGFESVTFPGNDDGSIGPVSLGFTLNFYGVLRNSVFVNNNGNVTFDSGLGTFTPFSLLSTNRQIIAPFFADVDTRAGNPTRYGTGTFGGRDAFGVTWRDVGYFNRRTDKLNSFQLLLVDRSDIAPGDFDIIFNYDQIQWETGNASGGSNGLGGNSARAGWSNGVNASFELPGSAVNGAFLDSNLASGLIYNRLNSSVDGRYIFNVRGGSVVSEIPEPSTFTLLVAPLALIAMRRFNTRA